MEKNFFQWFQNNVNPWSGEVLSLIETYQFARHDRGKSLRRLTKVLDAFHALHTHATKGAVSRLETLGKGAHHLKLVFDLAHPALDVACQLLRNLTLLFKAQMKCIKQGILCCFGSETRRLFEPLGTPSDLLVDAVAIP